MELKAVQRTRLPDWLKAPLPKGDKFFALRKLIKKHNLNTVCESASCPNIGTCWDRGALTIMILGSSCSRRCSFCDVPTGHLQPPDPAEPQQVAQVLTQLDLAYCVVTSVTRDDLVDGGANHWVRTIQSIKVASPSLVLETLVPDFKGNSRQIEMICEARPDIFSHNIETVASLQKEVRPQSRYDWSLKALAIAAGKYDLISKSGLMLGFGEKKSEVRETIRDLVHVGCQVLTLGQYLRPSRNHKVVQEYIHPDEFEELKTFALDSGFKHVEAGPLVRSSYYADESADFLNF